MPVLRVSHCGSNMAYWNKEKNASLTLSDLREMNPHEAFYGMSSGSDPVTAFISNRKIVLWSKDYEKSLNAFPSNIDTNYYENKFRILKQTVSLSIADKNPDTGCYII